MPDPGSVGDVINDFAAIGGVEGKYDSESIVGSWVVAVPLDFVGVTMAQVRADYMPGSAGLAYQVQRLHHSEKHPTVSMRDFE